MSTAETLHATCVAWQGQGAVILGASGSGKSALGLMLMALGCGLVADDRVKLSLRDGAVFAACPPTIAGLIEARGIGILNYAPQPATKVALLIDLDQTECERLPQRHHRKLLGQEIPLIYRVDGPHFAPAVLQILKAGWSDR